MEKSEGFRRIVTNIQHLEQRLSVIDENEGWGARAEVLVEDYFAKCVNALALQKDSLLGEITTSVNYQKKEIEGVCKGLSRAIEVRKKLLETGAFIYSTDINTAEHVWKGIANLPQPNMKVSHIKLDLSNSLFEAIKCCGKVSFVEDEEDPNKLKPHGKEKLVDTTPPPPTQLKCEQHEVSTQNIWPYSSWAKGEILAGSSQGLADGKGDKAKFNTPRGICWNPHDGCLYLCDKRNNSIRKLTLQGDVSTFVRDSKLVQPHEIVIHYDTQTFYVTNEYAHNIVKITYNGTVSVLAGSGKIKYHDGVGLDASFCYPAGIAIEQQSGVIFVTDNNNHAIRKITPQGEVSTFVGSVTSGYKDDNGEMARFNGPCGLFFDEINPCLFVCDYDNNRIRRVTLNGDVSTVCSIPRPSLATAVSGCILVASDENKLFTITREGAVRLLEHKGTQSVK